MSGCTEAIWPNPALYNAAFFVNHYRWCQPVVDELRLLKFPGAIEVWQKDYNKRVGYEHAHRATSAFGAALSWTKGQAKHVARRRVFGRCQPGGQCSAHKDARAVFHNGSYRGPCAEEPTYTEAFEALVLAEMPAALAEKAAADAAAVTAEALRRIKAEADAAEKQRVETARITALARQGIKQAAEKAAEEAAIQLEMARLLSTDETVAARIQLRGAELSGLF